MTIMLIMLCWWAPGYQRTVPGLVSSLLSLLVLPGAGAGSSEPPAAAGTDQSEWGEDGPWRMQDHLQSHSLPNGIMSFLTREVPGWLFPFLWFLYHTFSLIRRGKNGPNYKQNYGASQSQSFYQRFYCKLCKHEFLFFSFQSLRWKIMIEIVNRISMAWVVMIKCSCSLRGLLDLTKYSLWNL